MKSIPMLIAPGAGCAPRGWESFAKTIGKDRPCTVLNLRDCDTIESMADRALAVGPEKFILLGHSMGGYVALDIALRAPQRVEKLILANTQAVADSPAQIFARLQEIDGGPRKYNMRYTSEIELLHSAAPHVPDRRGALDILRLGLAGFEPYARHQQACMNRADVSGDLHTILIPTLVIAGEHDTMIPPTRQIEIAQEMPNAQLRIIANCGHNPQAEQPSVFSGMVEAFTALRRSYTPRPPSGGAPAP